MGRTSSWSVVTSLVVVGVILASCDGGGDDEGDCQFTECQVTCESRGFSTGVCLDGACDCRDVSADGDGDTDSDVDSDADVDSDVDSDTDVDGDVDGDTDTDSDVDVDTDADVDGDSDADGDAALDGSAGRCLGTAERCESLSSEACPSQLGCTTSGGSCVGVPTACADREGETACVDQGCSYSGSCVGLVPICGRFGTALMCEARDDCIWVIDECVFDGVLCSELVTAESCEGETRCNWQESCTGEPPACATIDASSDCALVHGCGWLGGSCSGTATSCDGLTGAECDAQVGCVFVD